MNEKVLVFLVIFSFSVGFAFASPLLSDQFGNQFDLDDVLATPSIVLLHSDERDATERLKYLSELVGPGVKIVAVADLSALPFFVPKKAVIESLKKDEPVLSILLDFKGELKKKEKLSSGSLARVYKVGRGSAEYRIDSKSKVMDAKDITSLKDEIKGGY